MGTMLLVLVLLGGWIGLNIAVATALARAFWGRPERRSVVVAGASYAWSVDHE